MSTRTHDAEALLTPAEQTLFRRLAVFVGGFTLGAAESVAGGDRAGRVLEGLASLVEQAMLLARPFGAGSFQRSALAAMSRSCFSEPSNGRILGKNSSPFLAAFMTRNS